MWNFLTTSGVSIFYNLAEFVKLEAKIAIESMFQYYSFLYKDKLFIKHRVNWIAELFPAKSKH